MQLQVKILGDKETIAYLHTVSGKLRDMSTPMKEIGTELKDYFSNDVFATQGGALGVKWPGLADSTIKQKSRRYRSYAVTPLVRTGAMKKAFYSKTDRSSVTIGNDASQFVYHQSSAPRKKIPYRPMLLINEHVESVANRVIGSHVDLIMRGRA
jgi:hypothetical protein